MAWSGNYRKGMGSVTHHADDEPCEDRSSPLSRWFFASRGYLDRRFSRIERQFKAVELALTKMGVQMSEVTDVLSELNDATNEVAGELEDNAAKIKELTDQLAAQDPQAAADLAEALSGVRAASQRLRDLAADPENPVPPVDDNPPGLPPGPGA